MSAFCKGRESAQQTPLQSALENRKTPPESCAKHRASESPPQRGRCSASGRPGPKSRRKRTALEFDSNSESSMSGCLPPYKKQLQQRLRKTARKNSRSAETASGFAQGKRRSEPGGKGATSLAAQKSADASAPRSNRQGESWLCLAFSKNSRFSRWRRRQKAARCPSGERERDRRTSLSRSRWAAKGSNTAMVTTPFEHFITNLV